MPQLTDKQLDQKTINKIRLILDKTYIDGYKSGGSGLGYSERAFDQIVELLAQAREDERQRIRTEIASYSPLSLEQTQDLLNRIDSLEDNT